MNKLSTDQAPTATMEPESEDWSEAGSEDAWSDDDPASDSEDGHYVLRYRAGDPRDATFRPGVGPYIECSVVPRFPYDACLL